MFMMYQDIENQVVDWLDREDIRSRVGEFVRMVTIDVTRGIRVPTMERIQVIEVLSDTSAVLPADLVEVINVNWVESYIEVIDNGVLEDEEEMYITSRIPLKRSTMFEYQKTRIKDYINSNNVPDSFTRVGHKLMISPLPVVPDVVVGITMHEYETIGHVELQYYALPVTLKEYDDKNWLLDIAPDVYFYGCLMHSYRFTRDYDAASYWETKYNEAKSELQHWADTAEYAGGVMVMGSN